MQRDFTYIDDIVEGVLRVIDSPAVPNPDWDAAAPDPGKTDVGGAPIRYHVVSSPARRAPFGGGETMLTWLVLLGSLAAPPAAHDGELYARLVTTAVPDTSPIRATVSRNHGSSSIVGCVGGVQKTLARMSREWRP